MKKRWDVVIVGGGLAGLVAANYLGKTNYNILLLEQSTHLGGRAKTNTIQKHYFNMGPHAFYKRGVAKSILHELDVQLIGGSPKPGGLLYYQDQSYQAPFSLTKIISSRLLNWRERMEWFRIIVKLLTVKIDSIGDISFEEWVSSTSSSRKMKDLLFTLCRLATYCHNPEMTSAKVIVHHLKLALGGVIYLNYGWQSIVDQLYTQAVNHDVQFKLQSSVKQIVLDNKPIKILLNEDVIHTNYIIFTGNPYHLRQLIPSKNSLLEHFLDSSVPIQAATMDIALQKLPRPNHSFALSLDQPYYYSLHSKFATLSTEEKSHILHVLKYDKTIEKIDHREIQYELENFLERNQPGWRQHVINQRFLPKITVNQRIPRHDDHLLLNHMKSKKLYMAGDWASQTSMLSEAAITTGKETALYILGELDANQ
ncbi:Phytoene dehydrogenase-related protein [Oceanobacillus limi]|uniref:Phytoene dehydrogenase-related protein n=1 Tax=Oceanobacillus limi TaxID=930131 RepID=A0A1I0HL88_9BACI|nr:FAD-dependent oxidoreductase [Oceanobacillus limi]SET84658.1 Phytoene dehydrogenase-related protein [Oceanobacillus limi]